MGETPDDGAGGDETMADARPVEERAPAPVVVAGRYEVKKLLGEGGMGEVHECRDRIIERSVALKTIRRDRSRRQLEPRMIREGRVQAQLEHPSIVPVYELGQDETGAPYFTMRKLTGTPLDEVIASGGSEVFTRHQLLTAFSQICLALEFAHARGVLHRDLKPANIMLGAFGEVYVLDWGVAKLASPDETSHDDSAVIRTESDRLITVAGTTLGTPGYMAPEQIGGTAIDARADVFALGAVLFEILTFEPLLDDTAIDARLRGRTATWDARPTLRAPKQLVPPEFDRICVRATAPDPAERYASARALHDEVEAYLDGVRDIGLRKELAEAHLARAEATRTKNRDEALREVNRALALAGEDRRALELLVDLLDTPAAAETARGEVEAEGVLRHRYLQPFVLIFTLPWFTFYPIVLWVRGVVSVPLAALPILAWAAASAATLFSHFRKTGETAAYPAGLFMLALSASSVVAGPLLLVPSIAAASLATFMLVQPRPLRRATYYYAVLGLLLPMLPIWLGLYAPYTFTDETTFVVNAITREMHGKNLGIFLAVTDLALVLGVAIFATQFRSQIDRARTERILMAWQLSKLLPTAMDGKDDAPASSRGGAADFDSHPLPKIGTEPTALASTIRPDDKDEELPPVFVVEGPRYVDEEELAGGLVRAHDRVIGRDVAMKRGDIQREALFQASVEHPFIPPIYDVGADAQGAWFTTKLVRGKRLSELIASKELGGARGRHERLTAFAKVCLTVEFAHARGILHSGLYADNIVLGDFGEVYVLGWSHAKRLATVDVQTDVRALCELLGALATGPDDALAKIAREEFPTARSLHDALEAFLSADRDEEFRRQVASERLAKAERRANRALENGDEVARVAALRELGRALALAPERAPALRLLARLLKEQPRQLPAEVKRELEEQIWEVSKKASPAAAILYVVAFLIVFPIYSFVVGVREPAKMIAVVGAWAVAALVVWGQSKVERRLFTSLPWAAVAAWLAIGVTSLVLGPWFITPAISITVTMVYALAVQPRWRYLTIALGGLAALIPSLPVLVDASDVLAIGGTTKPIFVIHGADYHPPGTFLFMLVAVNLVSVLAAGLYAAQYRDLLDGLEAENRAKVHALSRLM